MTNMRNPHLTFITTAIEAIGEKLPKPLAAAINDSVRINEHIDTLRSGAKGYPALAAAWADAVLDGRDPVEDRDVFRALLNSQLADGDLQYAASNVIADRAVAALTTVQDDILAMFKTAFDEAGRTLKNAHGILGNVAIDDTTTIFQLGSVAVKAHQDAQEARRVARIIDNGWIGLNNLTHFAGPGNSEPATRWTNSDIDTWERIRRSKDAWEITVAGATLDLATDRAAIAERQARLEHERAEREARPDKEAQSKRGNYLTHATGYAAQLAK